MPICTANRVTVQTRRAPCEGTWCLRLARLKWWPCVGREPATWGVCHGRGCQRGFCPGQQVFPVRGAVLIRRGQEMSQAGEGALHSWETEVSFQTVLKVSGTVPTQRR